MDSGQKGLPFEIINEIDCSQEPRQKLEREDKKKTGKTKYRKAKAALLFCNTLNWKYRLLLIQMTTETSYIEMYWTFVIYNHFHTNNSHRVRHKFQYAERKREKERARGKWDRMHCLIFNTIQFNFEEERIRSELKWYRLFTLYQNLVCNVIEQVYPINLHKIQSVRCIHASNSQQASMKNDSMRASVRGVRMSF